MSAYQDYIVSLTPQHYMKLDGDNTDSGYGDICSVSSTSGVDLNATPITKGATYSAEFTSGKIDYGDADDTNITNNPWFRRSYSCWALTSSFNENFTIFNEGASVRTFHIGFGIGGVVQYVVDNDSDSNPGCPWSQAIYSKNIKLNTPYHIGMVWESDREDTGPEGKGRSYVKAYLNGKLIQEKEIYKWDKTNNEPILTEPGGQLNGHSGNIELGLGQSIIVSGKVFSVKSLSGKIADMCWIDNVLWDDSIMWNLFELGATEITSTLTITDVIDGSEIRMFSIESPYDEIGTGVESSSTPTISIDYTVAATLDVRLVIISPNKKIFSEIITLPREDNSMNASILLKNDLTYRNN